MASKGKKFLIGCGIGCGALILMAIVVVISFSIWVSRPGELLEQESLLSSDTLGFIEWELSMDHPGTREFLEGLFNRAEANQPRGQTPLPPELEKLLLGWQNERNRKSFDEMFPLSAGWTLRAGGEEQEDRHLFSLSMEKAGNRLVFTDWVLGLTLGLANEPEAQKISYRDENIYQFGKPGRDSLVLFLRGNDLFFAGDLDSAKHAVDRLVEPDPSGQESAVEGLFLQAPEGSPLRGALSNRRGEVFRNWEKLALPFENRDAVQELVDALRGVVLSGGLTEDGQLEGRLDLYCTDAQWAAERADAALSALLEGLDYEGLDLEAEATADGSTIRIEFRLGGFFTLLDQLDDLPVRVN